MSQQTYRSLVQLRMEKKLGTLAKFVITDFYRLLQLINRQISSIIEYYRLIDYVFDLLRPDKGLH